MQTSMKKPKKATLKFISVNSITIMKHTDLMVLHLSCSLSAYKMIRTNFSQTADGDCEEHHSSDMWTPDFQHFECVELH